MTSPLLLLGSRTVQSYNLLGDIQHGTFHIRNVTPKHRKR